MRCLVIPTAAIEAARSPAEVAGVVWIWKGDARVTERALARYCGITRFRAATLIAQLLELGVLARDGDGKLQTSQESARNQPEEVPPLRASRPKTSQKPARNQPKRRPSRASELVPRRELLKPKNNNPPPYNPPPSHKHAELFQYITETWGYGKPGMGNPQTLLQWVEAQAEACPAVDLMAACKRARAWQLSAGARGQKKDVRRFLGGWFGREQDKPRQPAKKPAESWAKADRMRAWSASSRGGY